MRRYDDPVDVRKGMVGGPDGAAVEAPEQFLWRGRLWKVCDVVAHWVETGPWWQSSGVHAVLGVDAPGTGETRDTAGFPGSSGSSGFSGSSGSSGARSSGRVADPGAEREVWRVEAARGRAAASGAGPGAGTGIGRGVFDLVFDWTDGSWQLARCLD